jgi:hypothetical protein
MKIAVFGDSQVDPHHVRICADANPLIDYDHALKSTWYNLLKKDGHQVDVYAQVSRDNFWIDRKWQRHHKKYDLCIIRPAEGTRPYFRIPDHEWHDVHTNVFGNFGPGPQTFNYSNVDMNNPYIKSIHFWTEYMMHKDTANRVFQLLCKEWNAAPNTIVFPMNTIVNVSGGTELFVVENKPQKERREWVRYMMEKYPGININRCKTEFHALPYHRNPNHITLENHQKVYELFSKYIKTGMLETPVYVDNNETYTFPHPIMDQLEEHICIQNGIEYVK